MQCPKCAHEVLNSAVFCTHCGAQLKIICPECGASTQAGATFCSQCGFRFPAAIFPDLQKQPKQPPSAPSSASLHPQTDPYERRMVTILFADIASYSTLSETLDPEYLLEIMRDAYPSLLEPVQARDGTIVQVMGDGVLAYFGAPLAHEDDPERAILAGLEIVDRIQKHAHKLREESILESFHVRVGINTGLVVVGEMNPERHLDYIALGDAVNLAARLQQNAPIDSVLISHGTYQHVRGLFDVQPQAPLVVKGRQQIEQTYLVKEHKPPHLRSRRRGLEGISTTMIGREPEMAALKNYYIDAIQGGGTALILITGEAGIGKTRLVREFAGWVNAQPIMPIFLRGRAIPATQNVPYGVLRNLFAKSFGILETDSSAKALEKFRIGTQNFLETDQADLIGQLVGFDFKNSPAVARLLGNESFNEIASLYLQKYIQSLVDKSLLVILEDFHWMDDRTLDLISEVISNLVAEGESRLMIVGTARSQIFERRPKWGEGVIGFTRLELRRLSRLRSKSLIDEILYKVDNIPETFYKDVMNEAGGNPYFIEEMLKMLIEEGIIEKEGDPWQIKLEKLADLHVPSTLTGILQARLDSLTPPERLILQRAAIIGRTFWDDLVRNLTEEEGEVQQVDKHLAALRERGLVYHREHSSIAGSQEYLFKHALLCDAAYETVLLKRRRHYHKKVALWIEKNAGDRLNEHLSLIGNHYSEAGLPDLAADWLMRSAERALNQSSMQEAKDLFERALDLINEKDSDRVWRATLGHDEAVGALGELDDRHADDITLLNLAQQLKDDQRLAEAYFRIGSQSKSEGDNQAALHTFNKALEAAKRVDDVTKQALILPMLVNIFTNEGDLHKADTLVEHALALAQETSDANILARALNNISPYYQAIGDLSRSVQLMHQTVDINQQQGNRLGETFGLINLGYYYLPLGHFEMGHNLLERALKISRKLGALSCIAYSLLNLGLAKWRIGQPQAACQVLELSLDKLQALGDQVGLAWRQFYLGLAHEATNEPNEAAQYFIAARDAFKMLDWTSQIVETQAGLARLALQSKDMAKAEEYAMQIIRYLDQEGPQGLELPILVYLTCAKVFQATGDTSLLKHALEQGCIEIQARLDKIGEENWRETYRDAVPENRELIAFKAEGL